MNRHPPPSSYASAITYGWVMRAAHQAGLIVMGATHPRHSKAKGLDEGTLILLGAGPAFWSVLKAAPEWSDDDPIDRWSTRVITALAREWGADPYFPFGGPPYTPFIDWALKSGRTFSSPVGALVHDTVGMLISYRGALHFAAEFDIPETTDVSPCTTCPAPCTQTCPVGALNSQSFYDVDACHGYLSTSEGEQTCITGGCIARLSCPISAGAGRDPEQSAHHMRAFHPS